MNLYIFDRVRARAIREQDQEPIAYRLWRVGVAGRAGAMEWGPCLTLIGETRQGVPVNAAGGRLLQLARWNPRQGWLVFAPTDEVFEVPTGLRDTYEVKGCYTFRRRNSGRKMWVAKLKEQLGDRILPRIPKMSAQVCGYQPSRGAVRPGGGQNRD